MKGGARITEVFDSKELREGMNRQDTYQEGQKADDQLANFLFFSASFIQKRKRLKRQKNTLT
jgi:hypothetical protein